MGKLSAGGEQVVCGWLKDKFGVPWQIVPMVRDWLQGTITLHHFCMENRHNTTRVAP